MIPGAIISGIVHVYRIHFMLIQGWCITENVQITVDIVRAKIYGHIRLEKTDTDLSNMSQYSQSEVFVILICV